VSAAAPAAWYSFGERGSDARSVAADGGADRHLRLGQRLAWRRLFRAHAPPAPGAERDRLRMDPDCRWGAARRHRHRQSVSTRLAGRRRVLLAAMAIALALPRLQLADGVLDLPAVEALTPGPQRFLGWSIDQPPPLRVEARFA